MSSWLGTGLAAPASSTLGDVLALGQPRRDPSGHRPSILWLSVLLLAYLAVPVVVFVARSATSPGRGFAVPGLWGAFATSAEAATVSAAVVTLLGVPLAYLLARSHRRMAGVAFVLVQLPLALPPLMSGVVLLYVVGPGTWLGELTGGWFTESLAGIVLAQCFVAAPFLVVAARSAFRAISPNFEDIAATAGLGPLQRFLRVAVPIASGGIRAGLLLTWLRAFGEYGATVMLAYHPYSLPVFTYVQFSATGLPATQAPALLALALAAIVVALSRAPWALLSLRRPNNAPVPPVLFPPVRVPPAVCLHGHSHASVRPVRTLRRLERPAPLPVAFDLGTSAGSFHLDLRYRATTHRLALVGPSGAGKSLTLRALAGLAPGRVWFGDEEVSRLPAARRSTGYVPQGPNLMPHLSAWANMVLGPRADPKLAARWAALLGISDLVARRAHQLSGGQAQRVAIARALSGDPRVVLLDEPFTGLDAPVRAVLVQQLRRLQMESDLSTVLVTHDFQEAALLADEVVVVSGGCALQAGPIGEVARHSASPEVASLTGARNFCPGTSAGPASVLVQAPEGTPQVIATTRHGIAAGKPVVWCAPPELLRTAQASVATGNVLRGLVVDVADLGLARHAVLELGPGGPQLVAELREGPAPLIGSTWALSIDSADVMVWSAEPLPATRP